jgi:hypothetical protein
MMQGLLAATAASMNRAAADSSSEADQPCFEHTHAEDAGRGSRAGGKRCSSAAPYLQLMPGEYAEAG